MPDIQTEYLELMQALEAARRKVEQFTGLLEEQMQADPGFTEQFIDTDLSDAMKKCAEAADNAYKSAQTEIGRGLDQFALADEYEALCRTRGQLSSPGLQLAELLKKAGAQSAETLWQRLMPEGVPVGTADYSRQVDELSRHAVDPEAFRYSLMLTGKYAPVGDRVKFGSWDGEPVEWRVLEIKKDGACVLLSEKGLDIRAYNSAQAHVTWETCSLRKWLNGTFYRNAFSTDEKKRIVPSAVENPDNRLYRTPGGRTTQDRVYLLSLEEAGRYFNTDPHDGEPSEALRCFPYREEKKSAAYANGTQNDGPGTCSWWLRSPGADQDFAAVVSGDGCINCDGYSVFDTRQRVRPVICARL